MGLLATLDPRLSDYGVVRMTAMVALAVRIVEEAWSFMRPRLTCKIARSLRRLEGVVQSLFAPAIPIPGSAPSCLDSLVVLLSLQSRDPAPCSPQGAPKVRRRCPHGA